MKGLAGIPSNLLELSRSCLERPLTWPTRLKKLAQQCPLLVLDHGARRDCQSQWLCFAMCSSPGPAQLSYLSSLLYALIL